MLKLTSLMSPGYERASCATIFNVERIVIITAVRSPTVLRHLADVNAANFICNKNPGCSVDGHGSLPSMKRGMSVYINMRLLLMSLSSFGYSSASFVLK
jgi:hypothetical protein